MQWELFHTSLNLVFKSFINSSRTDKRGFEILICRRILIRSIYLVPLLVILIKFVFLSLKNVIQVEVFTYFIFNCLKALSKSKCGITLAYENGKYLQLKWNKMLISVDTMIFIRHYYRIIMLKCFPNNDKINFIRIGILICSGNYWNKHTTLQGNTSELRTCCESKFNN